MRRQALGIVMTALVAALAAGNIAVAKAGEQWKGDIKWEYELVEGSATIVDIGAFNGKPSGVLMIPSELDGYAVTRLGRDGGNYALMVGFMDVCSGITGVIIPDGVTSIGDKVFTQCERLTNVTIPDSVTSIGDYSFSQCLGLTNVIIPDGVLRAS